MAYGEEDCTSSNFIQGAARGTRTFALDGDGYLRGVTFPVAWSAGINQAVCLRANQVAPAQTAMRAPTLYEAGGFAGFEPGTLPALMPGWEHIGCDDVLKTACSCGFYAYHNRDTGGYYSRNGIAVRAVVEGFGKVVVGAKGFRAQKARILAVVKPRRVDYSIRIAKINSALRDIDAELAAVQKHQWWKMRGVFGIAGVSVVTFPFTPFMSSLTLAWLGYTAYLYYRRTKPGIINTLQRQRLSLEREALSKLPDADAVLARMTERYPDVQIFDTYSEMLEAFPVESLQHLVDDTSKGEN